VPVMVEVIHGLKAKAAATEAATAAEEEARQAVEMHMLHGMPREELEAMMEGVFKVWRCRLTVSKPVFKPPMVSALEATIWSLQLKLQYDEPLSHFAFDFDLSRYIKAADGDGSGILDRKEFAKCLKASELGLSRKEVNLLMSEVDQAGGSLRTRTPPPFELPLLLYVLHASA